MPNVPSTPEMVLSRTLDKAQQGRVKSVYISIEWETGQIASDWSDMPVEKLCLHAVACRIETDGVAKGFVDE